MTPSQFLHALWGATPPGLIQVWVASTRRTHYLTSPADLPELDWPNMPDIYTAVCTAPPGLPPTSRAKATTVTGTCGMWLDIDIEHGKAPDLNTAMQLASSHLEPTLVVHSGGGIHAWHLLNQPAAIPTSQFRDKVATLADAWQSAHQQVANDLGFRIDRTHDLARILRVAGTANGKKQPLRPVQAIKTNGPRYTLYDLNQPVKSHVAQALIRQRTRNTPTGATSSSTFRLDQPPNVPPNKFQAACTIYPEFAAVWARTRKLADDSQSAYDQSLASMASELGDWTDQEIVDLLRAHRAQRNPTDPKLHRARYYEMTLATAKRGAQQRRRDRDNTDRVDRIRSIVQGG